MERGIQEKKGIPVNMTMTMKVGGEKKSTKLKVLPWH